MDEEPDDELVRIRKEKLKAMITAQNIEPTPKAPVTVTDDTIDQFIRKYPFIVVDCWAAWCGPCQRIAPIVEELARDYSGKVVFGKLNVDENPKSATRYSTMSIPTLLVFRNGELVDRWIGAMPKHELEPRIKEYLKL